jgi:hypothetical protein
MRFCFAVLLLVLGLAGCVVPAPFDSPLPRTFDSPLPTPERKAFVPLILHAATLGPASVPSPKKGISLACGWDDLARMQREIDELRLSWVFVWGPWIPSFAGVESVPMIWGPAQMGMPAGGNSEWVIGFNEPDQRDQANLTPAEGARLWAQMEAAYPERKLTSPQVVHWNASWLEQWYAAYIAQFGRPPRMDAIAIHTYFCASAADCQAQVEYYIGLAKRWNVPEVWITEWTFSPGMDRTLRAAIADMREYMAWLEQEPMVGRYAVWTNRTECTGFAPGTYFDTPMFAQNGAITEMGKAYAEG